MRTSLRRRHPGAALHPAVLWPVLALGALLAWPRVSHTQPRPADPLPEALHAGSAVPTVQHQSTLARFRRAGETPVGSWREANDTVTRIGGWRVYTREAHAPETPASAPGVPAAKPMPVPTAPASGPRSDGHHGHHGPTAPAGARP